MSLESAGGREGETASENSTDTHTLPRVEQVAGGKMLFNREVSLVLCDDLEACGRGWNGRGAREGGICMYVWLTHFVVRQKLTQHCKAIILKKKKNPQGFCYLN